jgi:hypothetical protein
MQNSVKPRFKLNEAIQALALASGVEFWLSDFNHQPQAHPHAVTLLLNAHCLTFNIAVLQIDRAAFLPKLKEKLTHSNHAPLLVCDFMSDTLGKQCRSLGLNYLDSAGNAYIQTEGFFLSIQGQKKQLDATAKPSKGAGSPSHLRVVFALLTQPELLNANYRSIASAAHVALGTVGWVFYDLNQRGLILEGGAREDRVLLAREKLLQEWVVNFPIKLKPKLNPQRFHCDDSSWWQSVNPSEYQAHWGGEVAANKLTHYLKPQTVTLYMQPDTRDEATNRLVRTHKLRADPRGEIELLDSLWRSDVDHSPTQVMNDCAPPLLIYSDLNTFHDSRSLETAQRIYDGFIK